MELTVMRCPNCAGEIQYSPGKTQVKCPYCDSVVHISKTAEESRFEKEVVDLAKAKEKYLKQLAIFKKIKYAAMVLAFLSGILFSAVDRDSPLFFIAASPALLFLFAASPMVHSFAPEVPDGLEKELDKKEKPTTKGALYGIFIGLVFLAAIIVPSDDSDSSSDDSSTSSVVTEAVTGSDQ